MTILVTIFLASMGGFWNAYANRPIVYYALDTYYTFYAYGPSNPLTLELHILNTGQTDIVASITIMATNATLATKGNGNFSASLSINILLIARSNSWGTYTFYALPTNSTVTSFEFAIKQPASASAQYRNEEFSSLPALITYFVIAQTSFSLVGGNLTFVKNRQPSNTYSLQT